MQASTADKHPTPLLLWLAAGAAGLAEADARAKSSFSSYRSHQASSSIAAQPGRMTVAEILAQNKQLAVLVEQIASTSQQQVRRPGV
jgi:hypothetical protein